MTIHDRIKLVVKWLIGTGIASNQEAIGKLMGYTNKSSFSQILNNKVPIPAGFIGKLCSLHMNINNVWIEHEKGDMILNGKAGASEMTTPQKEPQGEAGIYYKMYKEKDSEVGELKEEVGALKLRIRLLESQNDKLTQHLSHEPTKAFTPELSEGCGEESLPTIKPPVSKTLPAGKA